MDDRRGGAEVYRFKAPRSSYRYMTWLLFLCVLAAVGFLIAAVANADVDLLVAAGAALALGVITWTLMLSRVPQEVTITNSIIDIKRAGKVEQFDLVDPNVEVLVRDGEMAFRYYDGRVVVIKAHDVDWEVFTDVVMHYQDHADRKAIERTRRFST